MNIEAVSGSDTEEDNDVQLYIDLIEYSVGCNPRSIKRLFNNFLLLNAVGKQTGKLGDHNHPNGDNRFLILFGLICMQSAYKEIYDYMLENRNDITIALLSALSDVEKLTVWDGFSESSDKMTASEKKAYVKKIAKFMSEFCVAAWLEDDDSLTEDAIDNIKDILSVSSITAISEKPITSVDESQSSKVNLSYLIKALQGLCKDDGAQGATKDAVMKEMRKIIIDETKNDPGPDEIKKIVEKARALARRKGLLKKKSKKNCWELTALGKRK
jgi:hypothetical protein